jgi:MFS transporter, PAT family, beta-lactamase induction signal transducer AmpG
MTESHPTTGLSLWGGRKMLTLALLGFASGLPLYLTSRTLQAWMRAEQVDLATIGVFSLVALPYSLKWIWAPVLDRYVPPFLGRRRGWLIIIQLALAAAIAAMAFADPRTGLRQVAVLALVIAFFSASQDIVIDAYRTDVLAEREMGAGTAVWVIGYRVALLATGALAFVLADRMAWPMVYLVLASLMAVGILGTLYAREPAVSGPTPRTFAEAVVLPFKEFLERVGARRLALALFFIVLYKLPDYLAGSVATPFLIDLRFTLTEIGAIQGGLGILATIVGVVIGGALVARVGINRALWVAGVLQAASNAAYYGLAQIGKNHAFLVGTIVVENVCTGVVTAAFVAFMMSLCNVRFSATQYALLSSLMGVSRDVLVAPAGGIAAALGWPAFFLLTVAAAIPGMLLLPALVPWSRSSPLIAADHTGQG